MKTTRHKSSPCPYCQEELDASSHLTQDLVPEEDDFSVCIACGGITRFNKDFSLRKSTIEEVMEELDDDEVLRMNKFVKYIKDRNEKKNC